jgi:glycine oxidase
MSKLEKMPPNSSTAHESDVVVIGGGIIGCSIAFRLAQARLKVCVLERGEPGAEASSAAAGMLAPQGEIAEPDEFFELCAASRDLYPSFVAEIEELSGQAVGYRRDGTLLVAISDGERDELDHIYKGQAAHGLALERLSSQAVHSRVAGFSPDIQSGLFIPGDHWVDNERLMQALVEACRRLGVKFLKGSGVTRINAQAGRVQSVEANNHSGAENYSADHFVLATGCWSRDLMKPLGITIPVEPCRGQMIEFEAPTDLPLTVRAGHHYFVPRASCRIIAGTTGEYMGFEKEVTGEGLRSILEGLERIAPMVKNLHFRRAWAGLRPDTPDHLPILGLGELKNLVFATGHFRNGILLAPITAQLIAELITSGSTPRSMHAYRPGRFTS